MPEPLVAAEIGQPGVDPKACTGAEDDGVGGTDRVGLRCRGQAAGGAKVRWWF